MVSFGPRSVRGGSGAVAMSRIMQALFLAVGVVAVSAFAPPSVITPTSTSTSTTIRAFVRPPTTRLWMGWGPDPIWETATVVSNEAACRSRNLVSVTLQVGTDKVGTFTIPGQYCQVKPMPNGDNSEEETKPLFLAVASPPVATNDDNNTTTTTDELEFLIKKTDNNGWMTSVEPGTTVQVSQILGGGFPMAENMEGFKYDFPTQNVLLFAAGSGIAPIRSAIESGQLQTNGPGAARSARLYFGARSLEEMPYLDRFQRWERDHGVEVVPVLSQPPSSTLEEGCRMGYVQTALEEDGVAIPRNSAALLCGMKGMFDAVKDILLKAGVFEGRILSNF